MRRRKVPGNGSLALLALGLPLLSGWLIWTQHRAISTARTTQGVVTETRIGKRRKNYVPVVRHRYEVDGRSFTGSRVDPLGSSYLFQGEAEAHSRPYSRGQTVSVHYAPEKPESAFLEAKVNYQPSLLCLGVGLVALVMLAQNLTKGRQLTSRRGRMDPAPPG